MKQKKHNNVIWAYLAGLVDGEGYITCTKHWRGNTYGYIARLGIKNTDKRLISWLMKNFGGNIATSKYPKNPRVKTGYAWTPKSVDIVKILQGIIPYLQLKGKQANLLLQYRPTVCAPGKTMTPATKKLREHITKQMRKLNKRGP